MSRPLSALALLLAACSSSSTTEPTASGLTITAASVQATAPTSFRATMTIRNDADTAISVGASNCPPTSAVRVVATSTTSDKIVWDSKNAFTGYACFAYMPPPFLLAPGATHDVDLTFQGYDVLGDSLPAGSYRLRVSVGRGLTPSARGEVEAGVRAIAR